MSSLIIAVTFVSLLLPLVVAVLQTTSNIETVQTPKASSLNAQLHSDSLLSHQQGYPRTLQLLQSNYGHGHDNFAKHNCNNVSDLYTFNQPGHSQPISQKVGVQHTDRAVRILPSTCCCCCAGHVCACSSLMRTAIC